MNVDDNDSPNPYEQANNSAPPTSAKKAQKKGKKEKKPSADEQAAPSGKDSKNLAVFRSMLIELATMLNDDKLVQKVRNDVASVGIVSQIASKLVKNDSEKGHDYHILGLAKKAMETHPNPQTSPPSVPSGSAQKGKEGKIDLGSKKDKKTKEPKPPPVRRVRLVGGLESCLTLARSLQLAIIEDDFEFARTLHVQANGYKPERAEDDNRSVIDFMFAEHRDQYEAFLAAADSLLSQPEGHPSRTIMLLTPNNEMGKPLLFKPLPNKSLAAGQSLLRFPVWKDLEGALQVESPKAPPEGVVR